MRKIYNQLVYEAKSSPMMLSDIAGLETYISESYTNRSFIELLQNADDAKAESFLVEQFEDYLIIANDGRCFNQMDVESLCRSASSNKARGTTIGYRGIGFKSVVSIVEEVHIISGDFEITFSKELTRNLIPIVKNVPLIRIPHPLRKNVKEDVDMRIRALKQEGYSTFFIFEGANIEQIKNEYSSFEHTSLLFLNNIKILSINIDELIVTNIRITNKNEKRKNVEIISKNKSSNWFVFYNAECAIAFKVEDGKIARILHNDAKIHAFLPTEDCCELGVVINADFSTDPSRRHIIYDDLTQKSIKSIAELYAKIFSKSMCLDDEDSQLIVKALLPYFDIRLIHLTSNAFAKQFSLNIKDALEKSADNITIAPKWINANDYCKLVVEGRTNQIAKWVYDSQGVCSLLKYIGCKEDNINSILSKVGNMEISLKGYAQIVSHCIKSTLLNSCIKVDVLSMPIFLSNSKLISLQEVNSNNFKIDNSFLELLYDEGISFNDFRLFLKKMSLTTMLENQFKIKECGTYCQTNFINQQNVDSRHNGTDNLNKVITKDFESEHCNICTSSNKIREWYEAINENKSADVITPILDIKKWRTAEENVLQVLNNNGFKLSDVSKQNLGYDLTGIDTKGKEVFIEVKSLDFAGQKFRLTNNEYAVAQYKKENYYVALIISNTDSLEISLIKNPINCLNLYRQCTQWIWECSEYDYNPVRVDF